ncbi:pirin family protein [Pseudomonas sp. S75]|uniref:pirin family protein n=1 Tax=unclassified Pseudomonas TaxID=196821 RepID=UPI001907FA23|nr:MULTISPECIES: pirin-like C-terminal cupin domain-containing protein [unclassified Pseudomonas]MBJ9974216.1 pirin family protein [Pseudomonas sp. S30]MBK0151854.1 pirin family protein [Pseudomonas sp. S75]
MLLSPELAEEIDPFLVLMEDWYSQGAFQNHPHRGIETVTYMLDGYNSHYDNHGNKGVIGPGEALWLTAGKGLLHNEVPVDDRPIHTLQLWVNLPRTDKLIPASFQELKDDRVLRRKLPGAEILVFSGASGEHVSPTRNHAKVTMVEVRLEPHSLIEQELPADYNGVVVVLEGEGFIGANAAPTHSGQIARLQYEVEESKVAFATKNKSLRAILFAGKPLREPIISRGPFVMNTEEEIDQAFAEFQRMRDRFGLDAV